jgi:hypothetical protein
MENILLFLLIIGMLVSIILIEKENIRKEQFKSKDVY